MCDYSLESVKSRKAAVNDRLIVKNFGTGTSGFAAVGEAEDVAVCLLPGTELAFDEPVNIKAYTTYRPYGSFPKDHPAKTIEHKVARFAKINQDEPCRHHDGLEFPDHLGVEPVLLTHLDLGQTATVLQLPVTEESKAFVDHNAAVPEFVG